MKYIIGKKVGMTQRFLNDGKAVGVTIVQAGPCHVTQVKTKEKEGYDSVQLGFDERKHIAKPQKHHLKDMPQYGVMTEFPQKEEALKRGDVLTARQFVEGDSVEVIGVSKGRGFQGVVKRHKFGGSPKSHGHKDQLRMPGSIGATAPAHVFKGTRMAGQMGNSQATSKNLEVIEVVPEENLILLHGSVPGPNGAIVTVFSLSTTPPPAEAKKEEPKAEEKPVEAKKEFPAEEKSSEKKEEPKAEEPK